MLPQRGQRLMTAPAAKRLLLIEDNPGDAALIRELLDEAAAGPWELSHCDGLSDGLIRAESDHFHVALLDLNLPDSVGVDTVRRLVERVPDLPIVVLTGVADEVAGGQALAVGAQDYLSKDEITPASLGRALRYALERSQLGRRLETARERERRTEERAELAQLSEQRRLDDSSLEPMMRDYGRLAMAYVQALRNREPRPSHRLLGFAQRLADLDLNARDLLRLHLLMLEHMDARLAHDPKGRQALARDARLALLELMGYLADVYRERASHYRAKGR